MPPLTVLRRLDCVLVPTKEKVLKEIEKRKDGKFTNLDPVLCRITEVPSYRFVFPSPEEQRALVCAIDRNT